MTSEQQLEIVDQHYVLNSAGDYQAAQKLLTDDFEINIPPPLAFAGIYRGKGAFVELIPLVVASISPTSITPIATTIGGGYAVVLVEFRFAGDDGPPARVAEALRFRGNQICEVRPYYFDLAPMLAAAERRKSGHG